MRDTAPQGVGSRILAGCSRRAGPLPAGLAAALCLLAAVASRPARAQSFGPPVQSEVILQFFDRQGHARFTLAAYYAQWENPFHITVPVYSRQLHRPVVGM